MKKKTTKLTVQQVHSSLLLVYDYLEDTDKKITQRLLEILDRTTLKYSFVLKKLYPQEEYEEAHEFLQDFLFRLNNSARRQGTPLDLKTIKKINSHEENFWFEGQDQVEISIEKYSADETSNIENNLLKSHAKPLKHKPKVYFFISYARKDNSDGKVDKFIDLFKEASRVYASEYHFEIWGDWHIKIGGNWNNEIQQALKDCNFGLLLTSISFLDRDYIKENELPDLLLTGRALPVGFKKLHLSPANLLGLNERQLFRMKNKERFYSECRGDDMRGDFMAELIMQIKSRISEQPEILSIQPAQKTHPDIGNPNRKSTTLEKIGLKVTKDLDERYIKNKARAAEIKDVPDLIKSKQCSDDEIIIATDYLMDWLTKKGTPPFCALLGEYGMGKTTTCQALTRDLLDKRKKKPSLPLPIYIDLREYSWNGDLIFTLDDILSHILKKSWKGGESDIGIKAKDIIYQVQENRALAIWDGLDEVIVHMPPKQANDFIRQLWRILPPVKSDKNQFKNSGKMLISCRSHYFRDVNQQNSMLTSEQRDGIKSDNYKALILLPFNVSQIETYLSKSLKIKGSELHRIVDLIKSVHNLPEMAERPYTLKLIAEHIPQIEQMALRGEPVQGVMLYQSMVESWLQRDAGKHQFSIQHKKELMEYFSAELWSSGQRQWSADNLDTWLDRFLYENPMISTIYSNYDREVLKEDLRTATFIVRPDDYHFRFAHTSLQEFFLAGYMLRAIAENRRSSWQLVQASKETNNYLGSKREESEKYDVTPSKEAFQFLYQLMQSRSYDNCLDTFMKWLSSYEEGTSKSILNAWTVMHDFQKNKNHPEINFRKSKFFQSEFKGSNKQRITLKNFNFTSSRFKNVIFENVLFDSCDFSKSIFIQAEFSFCEFINCKLQEGRFNISNWHKNTVDGFDLINTDKEFFFRKKV